MSAPLSFSQLAGWNSLGLGSRPSARQVAWAVRIHGKLDHNQLEAAARQVVTRHQALRTQIVTQGQQTQQIIVETRFPAVRTVNLDTTLVDQLDEEMIHLIEAIVAEPISLATDPLFQVTLLSCADHDHALIISLDHLIADAFSLNIVVSEVFAAYTQAAQGKGISLPAVLLQFPDYARGQSEAGLHWDYWKTRLESWTVARFPVDANPAERSDGGWRSASLQLGRASTESLRSWCRAKRTTLCLAAFAAYVRLIARWCGTSAVVTRYQYSGREVRGAETAVGYFSAVLHIGVELSGADSFVDVLHRSTDAYCDAYEHADLSYIDALTPRPEIARVATFNWVPHGAAPDLESFAKSFPDLKCSPVDFRNQPLHMSDWDFDPIFALSDAPEGLSGSIYYPGNRFSEHGMRRLATEFVTLLTEIHS